jgi:hypothetical protein
MNFHLIYNSAFQMVAAYMIFVAGFLALFAFSILCLASGHCTAVRNGSPCSWRDLGKNSPHWNQQRLWR